MSDLDKRTRILLAAVRIFARQGYHNAKIEEIAQEAEVGKGTVYEYFTSKQHLFVAMSKYSFDRYRDFVLQAVEAEATTQAKLTALVRCHLEFMRETSQLGCIIHREEVDTDGSLHKWILQERHKMLVWMEDFLREADAKGDLRVEHPPLAALAVMGAMGVVGMAVMHKEDTSNVAETAERLLAVLLHGLAVPENREVKK
ncbi:MAG: TetR/AcrR family transcriptional regulator [Heliobacteriaceae bacterium]|nr:TetR/AcrR family transcriptional regulator [Heliobacteriaceae bacterium]